MGSSSGETWAAVMAHEEDDKRQGTGPLAGANDLRDDEVETILATYDFFGASGEMLGRIAHDLGSASYLRSLGLKPFAPRFRVFDWLAMMVQTKDETLRQYGAYAGTQVMVRAFLDADGDVDGFIENLRVNDYDVDERWQSIVL